MKLQWRIERRDAARIRALIREQSENALVKHRKSKNLAREKRSVRKREFWLWMVSMRLTSIQRSGPGSHVAKFNRTRPFPLSYPAVRDAKRAKELIAQTLKRAGGIRFVPTIAGQLTENFEFLESGGWNRTLNQCNRLTRPVPPSVEREVARYIEDEFKGFGPKQARNLLQALGLTRYEIPIDSKVTEWLNEFGFPITLSATALADRNYYEFVLNGVQALCAMADVYPCILDAAVFATRDGDEWTSDMFF